MGPNDVPYLRPFVIPDPVAGSEWTHTCPGQGIHRIVALRAIFTAAVAVANRSITLVLSDGASDIAQSGASTLVTATTVARVSTFPAAPSSGLLSGVLTIAAPNDGWVLLPGWSLRSLVDSIQAADQWSTIRLWVAEYPTGPTQRRTPDVYTIDEPA